jgi:Flp pilus assembly protein TadB
LGRKGFLARTEAGKPTPVAAFGLDSTVLWDRLILLVAALPLVVGAVVLFRYQRHKKDDERREQLPAALAAEARALAAGSQAREGAHVYHGNPYPGPTFTARSTIRMSCKNAISCLCGSLFRK